MKKVLVLLCVLVFNALVCFADYKPIPADKSKQYKAEIESYINNKYPSLIKEIKQISNDAEKEYNKVMQNPKDFKLYMDFCASHYDMIIDNPEFYLYVALIDITQKYAGFSDDERPVTDWSGALRDFLDPYFKDNNINTTELNEIEQFVAPQYEKIEQYYKNTHKAVYPEEY